MCRVSRTNTQQAAGQRHGALADEANSRPAPDQLDIAAVD
jgi:hypothetical protein